MCQYLLAHPQRPQYPLNILDYRDFKSALRGMSLVWHLAPGGALSGHGVGDSTGNGDWGRGHLSGSPLPPPLSPVRYGRHGRRCAGGDSFLPGDCGQARRTERGRVPLHSESSPDGRARRQNSRPPPASPEYNTTLSRRRRRQSRRRRRPGKHRAATEPPSRPAARRRAALNRFHRRPSGWQPSVDTPGRRDTGADHAESTHPAESPLPLPCRVSADRRTSGGEGGRGGYHLHHLRLTLAHGRLQGQTGIRSAILR